MCEVRLEFDTAPVEAQLQELQDLLRLKPAPDKVVHDFTSLVADVVLGDDSTAVVAGETVQSTKLRFGARFESLMTALRAGDWNGAAHVLDGLRSLQPAPSR